MTRRRTERPPENAGGRHATVARDGVTPRLIGRYALLAIALSWVIQLPPILLFGLESGVTRIAFVVTMWSPTALALCFMAYHRQARAGVRWRLGRVIYLPLGIVAETLVAFGTVTIVVAAGMGRSGWFDFGIGGVTIAGGSWVIGIGHQGWPLFLANVLGTAATFSIVGLIATTGEEFAWRGFLQGHLEQAYGVIPAVLRVALIWWAWHLPGLLAGYNFPETPLLGAFVLFPLQMIGASLFFGWLTIRSDSFWPAALAHAAVNSIQQGVFDNLQVSGPSLHAHLVRTLLILCLGLACVPSLIRDRARPGGRGILSEEAGSSG